MRALTRYHRRRVSRSASRFFKVQAPMTTLRIPKSRPTARAVALSCSALTPYSNCTSLFPSRALPPMTIRSWPIRVAIWRSVVVPRSRGDRLIGSFWRIAEHRAKRLDGGVDAGAVHVEVGDGADHSRRQGAQPDAVLGEGAVGDGGRVLARARDVEEDNVGFHRRRVESDPGEPGDFLGESPSVVMVLGQPLDI